MSVARGPRAALMRALGAKSSVRAAPSCTQCNAGGGQGGTVAGHAHRSAAWCHTRGNEPPCSTTATSQRAHVIVECRVILAQQPVHCLLLAGQLVLLAGSPLLVRRAVPACERALRGGAALVTPPSRSCATHASAAHMAVRTLRVRVSAAVGSQHSWKQQQRCMKRTSPLASLTSCVGPGGGCGRSGGSSVGAGEH